MGKTPASPSLHTASNEQMEGGVEPAQVLAVHRDVPGASISRHTAQHVRPVFTTGAVPNIRDRTAHSKQRTTFQQTTDSGWTLKSESEPNPRL